MKWARRILKLTVTWAAANPAKAAELAIVLAILSTALVTTGRLDRRALRRAARVLLF